MRRTAIASIIMLLGLASTASSQLALVKKYAAVLDCSQLPGGCSPSPSAKGAQAIIELNADGSLSYSVQTFGVQGATSAHFHKGAPGVSGAVVFTLAGGPTSWSGTTSPLMPSQEADLSAGLYYVDIHTTTLPAGAIRGQIFLSPNVFGARLDNTQETIPNSSTAKGNAFLTLNPSSHVLTYQVTTTAIAGGTSAHIHAGKFGIAGGVEISLSGGPVTWSGSSPPLSNTQISALQTLGLYIDVHTIANPGGEIRGQIVSSGLEWFNSSSPDWASMLTMTVAGAPTDVADNGTFTISITGGKPGGLGLMFNSFAPGAMLLKQHPLLIAPPFFAIVSLSLDGSGALTLPVLTPQLPMSFDLALQFFGTDNTAPNGQFNVSNGLVIPLQHF